jgi:hypothetical protein
MNVISFFQPVFTVLRLVGKVVTRSSLGPFDFAAWFDFKTLCGGLSGFNFVTCHDLPRDSAINFASFTPVRRQKWF